jgi:hypothetical protein
MLHSAIIKRIHSTIDELNIKEVNIITVGNSDVLLYNSIEINILPFYEWAVQ